MTSYTVNELLCFVSTQFDKLDRQNLNSTILEFYNRDDFQSAKSILVSLCEKNGISDQINESKKNRIGANVNQRVAKDILDIWEVIDTEKGGNIGTEFVAANPLRLPSVNGEKYNLKFLVSTVLKVQEQNVFLTSQLESITKSLNSLQQSVAQTSSFASPHLVRQTDSPRRKLPAPKEVTTQSSDGHKHARKSKPLDANTPLFVPRLTGSVNSSPAPSLPSAPEAPLSPSAPEVPLSPSAPEAPLSPSAPEFSSFPSTKKAASHTLVPKSSSIPPTPEASTLAPAPEKDSHTNVSKATAIQSSAAAASSVPTGLPSTPIHSSNTESTPKSFSSLTKNLSSTPWNLVKARNKRKIIPITGQAAKNDNDDLEGVPPVIRDFWDISVSRLKDNATTDKVKSHLHKHGIEVREVFILSSKIRGTKSAKVRVAREHKDRVKAPEIWPQYCRVADWVNFKKKVSRTDGGENGAL